MDRIVCFGGESMMSKIINVADGLICPYCGHLKSTIMSAKQKRRNTIIFRRRKCFNCNKKFTTHELVIKSK
jgi:hypothetical protein